MMALPLATAPMIGRLKQRRRGEHNLGCWTLNSRRRNEVGKDASLERLRPGRRWSVSLASAALICKDWIDGLTPREVYMIRGASPYGHLRSYPRIHESFYSDGEATITSLSLTR